MTYDMVLLGKGARMPLVIIFSVQKSSLVVGIRIT